MAKYPKDLLSLMEFLKKLPGVGSKTAERFAFHLLGWPQHQLEGLSLLLGSLKEKIRKCPDCLCLMELDICPFCDRQQRETHLLCLISSPKDAYAIEETKIYRGLYHVIETLLSPLQGRHPEQLNLERLKKRIDLFRVQEVILALDSTIEGDVTALYLKESLQRWGIATSRLAYGLPLGSTLDFVDGGTLKKAFSGRQNF